MRIRTIDEDENGVLSFLAEELPAGIGTYFTTNAPPLTTATTMSTAIDPGPVNIPCVCEPASTFAQGKSVVLIAASGGANWGGANVFLSLDGTDYSQVGTLGGPALQATLTAALPAYAGTNPDTTDTLSADATQSGGVWPAASTASAQNYATLAWVSPGPASSGGNAVLSSAGELLAFGAVAATGTYTANLTYLERGLYCTGAIAHATGEQFTLLDSTGRNGSTLVYDLPAQYVGRALYLKFQSFNVFGAELEDLSTVTTYEFVPTGASFGSATAGVPSEPAGLGGIVQSSQVLLTWAANPAADNVAAYALYRAAGTSEPFTAAALIWSGDATAFADTNVNLVTGYTYYLVAINAIGDSLPSAAFNASTAGINDGQVLQTGNFAGVSEASIDFNPQVLACGFIELTVWDCELSANANVAMVYRAGGADVTGSTHFFAGTGSNGDGSSGIHGSGASLAIISDAAAGDPAMAYLRIWIGNTLPRVLCTSCNQTPSTFQQLDFSATIESAMGTNPTGLSLLASSGTMSLSYAIKGYVS